MLMAWYKSVVVVVVDLVGVVFCFSGRMSVLCSRYGSCSSGGFSFFGLCFIVCVAKRPCERSVEAGRVVARLFVHGGGLW